MRFLLVGHRTDNQGVVLVAARRGGGSGQLEGFARVANTASTAVDVSVRASADDVPIETRPVHLAPRSDSGMVFQLPPGTTRFGASIVPGDLLASDDAAQTSVESARQRRVLLVASATSPIAAALRAMPGVTLSVVEPGAYAAGPADGADVVVFEGFLPPQLPRLPIIAIHPPPGAALVSVGGELTSLDVTAADRSSPLLTGVDTTALHVSGAGLAEPPAWGTTVLSAANVPLVVVGQLEGRRVVVLGFDATLAKIDQTAALPVLVANAVSWVSATPASDSSQHALDVTPLGHAELDRPAESAQVTTGAIDIWRWLVVACIGVCGLEWWYFSRHA
jgi:hypothetical protein